MKTMFKSFAIVLVTVYLVGCATGPKFSEISPSLTETMPNKGRIYIYRTAILGAAVQPEVKLNGEGDWEGCSEWVFLCRSRARRLQDNDHNGSGQTSIPHLGKRSNSVCTVKY